MKFFISFLLLYVTTAVTSQPGTLDNSFGANGQVIENFGSPKVKAVDAVIQTDGKTVVLTESEFNHNSRAVLIRYNTNGTADPTFSADGIADTSLLNTGAKAYPLAIKLQTDGKILVCGTIGGSDSSFLFRLNSNGLPDVSFGSNGIIYISDSGKTYLTNLVLLPNGQIVLLATYNNYPDAEDMALIHLNSDGSIHTAFGINGRSLIDASVYSYVLYSHIAVQADGKFIIGGSTPGNAVTRVNEDGTLDTTYGNGGTAQLTISSADYEYVSDMTLQPDGKTIGCGTGRNYLQYLYSFIFRLQTNGTPDPTFGNGGIQMISPESGFAHNGLMSLQQDGKILLGGFMYNADGIPKMAAARLGTNGFLDTGFDGDGFAALIINKNISLGFAPLQQQDGKVIITGIAGNNNRFSATVGRFETSGLPDNSLNANAAIVYTGTGNADDEGRVVLLQPDQKIINIRKLDHALFSGLSVTRHLPNGTPDSSFGINGRGSIELPGTFYYTAANLLSNGKIMIVCELQDLVKGEQIALFRFHGNGIADSTFGLHGRKFFNTAPNSINQISSASIQQNGKTVVLLREYTIANNPPVPLLIRLNDDGNYDSSFNGNGKLLLSDTAQYVSALVQTDGKILVSYCNASPGNPSYPYLIRLHANGTFDNGFNGGHALQLSSIVPVPAIALQPDDKIILAWQNNLMVRLNPDGSFDSSFDGDGSSEPGYLFNAFNISAIEVQADGKLLLSGEGQDSTGNYLTFQVVRINSNGSLDSSFASYGTSILNVAPGKANFNTDMILQADGRIILNGFIQDQDLVYYDFAMIRLNNSNNNVGITYTFTGSGAWNVPANWSNNAIPPATLPSGSTIIIDPMAGGECVFTGTQHISVGAIFTVKAGKKFRVAGNLILQQ